MSQYVEFEHDPGVAATGPTAPSSGEAPRRLFGDGALEEVDDIPTQITTLLHMETNASFLESFECP